MKNKIPLVISFALLLGLLATNSVAYAANGKATPFKAIYTDLMFNTFDTCSSTHVL